MHRVRRRSPAFIVVLGLLLATTLLTAPLAGARSAVVEPSGWESFGGIITSDPAVVTLEDDSVLHLARGADGALWRYTEGLDDGLGADTWASLGGGIVGGPAAVVSDLGVEVFVRGLDDGLWHRTLGAAGWSAWEELGGTLTSDPAAWPESLNDGQAGVAVFVRGSTERSGTSSGCRTGGTHGCPSAARWWGDRGRLKAWSRSGASTTRSGSASSSTRHGRTG